MSMARFASNDALPSGSISVCKHAGPLGGRAAVGIDGLLGCLASTAKARYQLIHTVDLHVRSVDSRWPSEFRLGDSHHDMGAAGGSVAGSAAAFAAPVAAGSIGGALPVAAAAESVDRVDGVAVADGGNVDRQSRLGEHLLAQIVVVDALVGEAETALGAAVGRRKTIFANCCTFLRRRGRWLPSFIEAISYVA